MEEGASRSCQDCKSAPGDKKYAQPIHAKRGMTGNKRGKQVHKNETQRWATRETRSTPMCFKNSTHLLTDDHHLLSGEIFEGEDKSPVEVALPIHGPVMDVSLLGLVLTTYPAGEKES